MRLSFAILAACGFSLWANAGAFAYPWPVRPFHQQHPIRANFGDPRTVFEDPLVSDGIDRAGTFLFHNGVDIAAPDGTGVYPVLSGVVTHASGLTVTVRTRSGRAFMYVHIVPLVEVGDRVRAQRTLLGYIAATYGHVHLTEIRGFKVWNPLARGGIEPYRDLTDPTVRTIYVRRYGTLEPIDPLAICGRVSIAADAYDSQSERVPGSFAGFPVGPARVTWSLEGRGGTRRLASLSGATDFRTTLPTHDHFWNVYARGSYQNGPRFGRRQYRMPGLFLYQLTHQGGLDTRTLANGRYRLTVRAYDIKGNEGSLVREIKIANDPSTPAGCKPPAPLPVSPPPPPTTTTATTGGSP